LKATYLAFNDLEPSDERMVFSMHMGALYPPGGICARAGMLHTVCTTKKTTDRSTSEEK
jgi:hypothetical protein